MGKADMRAINSDVMLRLSKAVKFDGITAVASELGVHYTALKRALDNQPVSAATAEKLSRSPKRTRTAEEFESARRSNERAPKRAVPVGGWRDLECIRAARTDQLMGRFARPVQLAASMRTEAALFTAYLNRLAPQSVIQTALVPYPGVRGEAVAAKARNSVIVPGTVLTGIVGTLVNHGVAIGYVRHTPNDEGTRVDMRLEEWPLEYVHYDAYRELLLTPVLDGYQTVPIVHGDGHWIIFRKFGNLPWTQDAAILPAAFVWAATSGGMSDWAASSMAHGLAKIVGELPEGVPLQGEGGELTAEADAFLHMLQDLASGDAAAGIRVAGSKTEFLANGSTAWQVFSELVNNREKAAARIYQGTDATLGSVGGAPGVDITALFGVAATKVLGDFAAIEQGLNTGLYEPWTAINEGDSRYAPRHKYLVPDPDADAKSAEQAARRERLFAIVDRMKTLQMVVDQAVIAGLCKDLMIEDMPKLASTEQQSVPITFAPTDLVTFVSVREARSSQGLPPYGDSRDDLSVAQYKAQIEAAAAASQAQAQAEATATAQAPSA
jgi:hypothetical protein